MARLVVMSLLTVALFATVGSAAGLTDNMKTGNPQIQSASQLAFGPEGILFVGDARQAAVFAIATGDTKAAPAGKIAIKGLNEKIAAMLGVPMDQLAINDVKVNPISHKVYLAVSRGRGTAGVPLIMTVDGSGKIAEFPLTNAKYSMTTFPDVPEVKPDGPARYPEGTSNANTRLRSISDISYINGKVLVSGMSNQDFASDLRSIPFPFQGTADKSSGIRIWHAQHGRYETQAPIDKFMPYTIDNKEYILASYACTPIVKIPLDELKPGAKVMGTTVAEIGNHNTPLEFFGYKKDGRNFLLMAGSTRGVMKFSADGIGKFPGITPPSAACEQSDEKNRLRECGVDQAGIPYETIHSLKGVWQMVQLDDRNALVLAHPEGAETKLVDGHATWTAYDPTRVLDLTTIALP